jgi:hypothetical protein
MTRTAPIAAAAAEGEFRQWQNHRFASTMVRRMNGPWDPFWYHDGKIPFAMALTRQPIEPDTVSSQLANTP